MRGNNGDRGKEGDREGLKEGGRGNKLDRGRNVSEEEGRQRKGGREGGEEGNRLLQRFTTRFINLTSYRGEERMGGVYRGRLPCCVNTNIYFPTLLPVQTVEHHHTF